MLLSLLCGFIRWPQILMIIGAIVTFIVVMGIPKAVKEITAEKKEITDATNDANTDGRDT